MVKNNKCYAYLFNKTPHVTLNPNPKIFLVNMDLRTEPAETAPTNSESELASF